jgi:hypothetical protein
MRPGPEPGRGGDNQSSLWSHERPALLRLCTRRMTEQRDRNGCGTYPRTRRQAHTFICNWSDDRFPMPSPVRMNFRPTARILLVVIATTATAAWGVGCAERVPTIPERLDDSTFWSMVNELSEPGGYFHSDNFVSNELGFQYVISEMLSSVGTGSVYVGVGPDQNFTYVAAMKPRIAFVVDIRRQNMLQHLMYKALIEMSTDRADFLGRLFSRVWEIQPPRGLEADSLFSLLGELPRDSGLYQGTLTAIFDRLTRHHRFILDTADSASLRFVFETFFSAGTGLTYSSNQARGFGSRGMPSYRMLMTATDAEGRNRSYMGSDETFGILKDLQERNLIVPVVGDFAGPHALRAVGAWLQKHEAPVGVFYVSNVEQYLFQQSDAWKQFYANVSTMPLERNALFVRSVSNRSYRRSQHPYARSQSVTSRIDELLSLYRTGRLNSYSDVGDLSR